MEKLGNAARFRIFEDEDSKVLYLCPCSSLDVLSERITTSSPNFGLLLAIDARGVKNQDIWQAAEKLVAKGLVYLCVWGPECERVHDSFDDTISERELDAGLESTDENVIMTTWHSEEPLSEALWFFINSAFPARAYEKTCKDWIIAPIGNSDWEQSLRAEIASTDLS